MKRPTVAHETPGVVVWITPWLFITPLMVAVGIARIVVPKAREDLNAYLKGLRDILTEALSRAVEYQDARAKQPPSRPPTSNRRNRPAGSTRPGGKPGAPRTAGRGRVKR